MENSENVFIYEPNINPINTISNKINNFLDIFSNNTYISTFILLFFLSYGSFLGSGGKPPKFIIDLFSNPVARILLLSIIVFQVNHDIQISLIMSIVFFLTQQYIFKQESFEQLKNLEEYQKMYYSSKK
jgi:O-antigen ligase